VSWIAALLMLVGSAGGSATIITWSPNPLRAGPSWVRTPPAGPYQPSIRASSDQAPETILYTFKGISTGIFPSGGLTEDAGGSLFGTTQIGGLVFPTGWTSGGGTVFKVTRKGSTYTQSVIHKFGASLSNDGAYPNSGNGLAVDSTGALYGTTADGGAFGAEACGGGAGCGIVYKLEATAHGYREAILHTFLGMSDGSYPATNPILDQSGALYGTTTSGGSSLCCFGGGVYKLTPTKSGYSFRVLYTFGTSSVGKNDGAEAWGALLRDEKSGDLYGTTLLGGINQNGIVFKLSPTASGYRYTIIHMFAGLDGAHPYGSLIMDSAGALYGTTYAGGTYNYASGGGCGTVYKLTPASTGYVESVLHDFSVTDGCYPLSQLVADRSGNLYSMASAGGQFGGGTVFKLAPTSSGYSLVTLHAFNPTVDGEQLFPTGLLLVGDDLFGETGGAPSGPNGDGNVFALKI
jgi:uncharacterized repeat protein (TIGR03803 family)